MLKSGQYIKTFSSYREVKDKLERPECQREIDDSHVTELLNHILSQHEKQQLPIFGSVDLGYLHGKYYILDGQHRLIALRVAYEIHKLDIPFHAVIYDKLCLSDLNFIFLTRNKNMVMATYHTDMVDIINSDLEKANAIKLKKDIGDFLVKSSPMFRAGSTRRPNINIDLFLNNLEESEIFPHIKNLEDFKIVYLHYNNHIKRLVDDGAEFGLTKSTIAKCKQANLFFGLYMSFTFDKDVAVVIQKLAKKDS